MMPACFCLLQAIWAKGYTELLSLMEEHKRSGAPRTLIDAYGGGEDLNEVRASCQRGRMFSLFFNQSN